jgi:uncharacterized membrane protein YuzA (DUF378 family)
MNARTVVAVTGAVVVTAYAVLLALDALVLDPLTAVPGRSLSDVYAHVAAAGDSVVQDVSGVLVLALVGVALGVAAAVVGVVGRVPALQVALMHLVVVVLGALATFQSMFFLGFDVADAFATSGLHSPWVRVLYGTSGLALLAIPTILFVSMVQGLRRARAAAVEPTAGRTGGP